MRTFVRQRTASLSMVVLVLAGILLLQEEISYSTTFGRLEHLILGADSQTGFLSIAWIVLRSIVVALLEFVFS